MTISSRIYQGKEDFQAMIDLIDRARPWEYINDFPGRTDIEEALASPISQTNTRLWFKDSIIIGWAYIDGYNNLFWELDPQYTRELGSEIMKWGEMCIQRNLSSVKTGTLYANCRDSHAKKIAFLKQHGFNQLEDTTLTLTRPLSDPIPEPQLPPGFIIRPILGRQEAEAVAAMHRAAFGTDYMTTENRLIIMSTSGYDPSLDLVVIAPDGSIAANCICSVNQETGIGFTDPVSAHPRYQGIGLVHALLLTGLRLLKEHGMSAARLGTSGNNVRMQRSAESVGFTVEYKTIWFKKEIN